MIHKEELRGALFIIKRNDKTYQRRQITSSGTLELTGLTPDTKFTIEGKYSYYNEQQEVVEETFYIGEITTKSIKDLGSIILVHEAGQIYSNKIELKNLGIENELTNEVIKGISKIEIEIDGIRYKLTNKQVNSLKNKEKITYQTSESVKSNKEITYKIYIYDKDGNELKVDNSEGKTRTSKEAPTVRVKMEIQEINKTQMAITLTNKDNVKLENYYYVIEDGEKEIVKESLNSKTKEITRTDLDPNGYYTIKFYADYDLEDENGKRENVLIGEAGFTTMPIESLGEIYWNTQVQELGTNNVVLSIQMDELKTDNRLIQMIEFCKLVVTDQDGNEVFTTELDKEKLKTEEIVLQEITPLISNTQYNYEINTQIKQGSVECIAQKQQTENSFITKKKPTKVLIRNQFVTGDFIDFDVKVQDEDGASLTRKH